MKKVASVLIGLGMMVGTVVVATPANAVSCEVLAPYSVKELKKKYKKKKRQCIRLEREQKEILNAQKSVPPPTVSNLMVIAPSTQEQDYRYDEETSRYAVSWQIPEAAKSLFTDSGVEKFILTMGDKTETEFVYNGKCENGVCTFTEDFLYAPWGSTAVVGVTSVSRFGTQSEMVLASAVMPARPNQNKTYTFVANGERTLVPTQGGGDNWADGNQSVTYTFNRRVSLSSWKYSVYASNYYGPSSCQIYRDGVLVDEEYSNGGSAFCSV